MSQQVATFSLEATDSGVALVVMPGEGLTVSEALELLRAVVGEAETDEEDVSKPWGWGRE